MRHRLLNSSVLSLLLSVLLLPGALPGAEDAREKQGDSHKESKDEKGGKSEKAEKPEEGKKGAKDGREEKEQKPKEKAGSVVLGSKEVPYVAQTGTMPILKDDGESRASVFYVYYAVVDAGGKRLSETDSRRPIMFCFNGGPGASAAGGSAAGRALAFDRFARGR
jgi:carboxypeptidase C (cathepsin A)